MSFTCWWIGFVSSWFCRWQPMHWLTTSMSAILMEWTHLSPNLSRLWNWSRYWSSIFLVLTALKAPQCNWLPMNSGQEKLCYCTRNQSRGVCTTVQSEFMECFFVEWSCPGEYENYGAPQIIYSEPLEHEKWIGALLAKHQKLAMACTTNFCRSFVT